MRTTRIHVLHSRTVRIVPQRSSNIRYLTAAVVRYVQCDFFMTRIIQNFTLP